jgi:hypothetical protein
MLHLSIRVGLLEWVPEFVRSHLQFSRQINLLGSLVTLLVNLARYFLAQAELLRDAGILVTRSQSQNGTTEARVLLALLKTTEVVFQTIVFEVKCVF